MENGMEEGGGRGQQMGRAGFRRAAVDEGAWGRGGHSLSLLVLSLPSDHVPLPGARPWIRCPGGSGQGCEAHGGGTRGKKN